jgi:gamma-glutamyl:cysteine ligase YbdK (ATP-grasp superfamily)
MREHAQDLGSDHELEALGDIIRHGNGASRQLVVYEANQDHAELLREIVAATVR